MGIKGDKMKIITCAILIFLGVSFNSLLFAEEMNLLLPADAVKINEKNTDIGPVRSVTQTYTTSLSQDRINAFYKKEMSKAGWTQKKNNFFVKDNDIVILLTTPNPSKDRKSSFGITTSRIPVKEEFLAGKKDNPDKLSFMPVLPGSSQTFLWDLPRGGISASYETTKNIKDVLFFYKSAMLNYGWSLSSETPIETKQFNDCPGCRKKAGVNLPKEADVSAMQGTSSTAGLVFRKPDGEKCNIRLYQTLLEAQQGGEPYSNKTNILVTYSGNKKTF